MGEEVGLTGYLTVIRRRNGGNPPFAALFGGERKETTLLDGFWSRESRRVRSFRGFDDAKAGGGHRFPVCHGFPLELEDVRWFKGFKLAVESWIVEQSNKELRPFAILTMRTASPERRMLSSSCSVFDISGIGGAHFQVRVAILTADEKVIRGISRERSAVPSYCFDGFDASTVLNWLECLAMLEEWFIECLSWLTGDLKARGIVVSLLMVFLSSFFSFRARISLYVHC